MPGIIGTTSNFEERSTQIVFADLYSQRVLMMVHKDRLWLCLSAGCSFVFVVRVCSCVFVCVWVGGC